MFLQTSGYIEHRVAWRIEAGEQFVNDNDDVRIGRPFELLYNGPVKLITIEDRIRLLV